MRKYLIWSNEHKAWWAPNRLGYVRNDRKAGQYTLEEATKICEDANGWHGDEDPPEESMVPCIERDQPAQ